MILYRLLEYLTGQTSKTHKRIISYRVGQKVKVFILRYIIRED